MKKIFYVTILATLLTIASTIPVFAGTGSISLYSEINAKRDSRGVNPLSVSKELERAASVRAEEAAMKWSHQRPDGSLFCTISPEAGGENLQYVSCEINDTEHIVNAWMASASHRDNILYEDFKITGIGVYYDEATGLTYYCQLFGY